MSYDRRKVNGIHRRLRLAAGSVSAPLAIVINYVLNGIMGEHLSTELVIATSSLVGSFVGVGAICFWDLRDILLGKFAKRREEDNKNTDQEEKKDG